MREGRIDRVQATFLCECGRSLCDERIAMPPSDYDALANEHPALAPGHEHWSPDSVDLGECRFCRERRRSRNRR
jgi:hypothetical protein